MTPTTAATVSVPNPAGEWRLDSLAVYPLTSVTTDSMRKTLDRFQQMIGAAVSQVRSGELRIVTRYGADGR